MTFPKLSGFIHFSKTFPGLENAVLKCHDFSRFFMTVRTLSEAVALIALETTTLLVEKAVALQRLSYFIDKLAGQR